MLAEAKREAERVVKEARDQQSRLISEEEVYKQAERAAEEIIEDARETERQIRLGAEDYADEILSTLEVNLEKFLAAVRRGRDRLAGPRGRAGRGRLAAGADRPVSRADKVASCRLARPAAIRKATSEDVPDGSLTRSLGPFEDDPGFSHLLPDPATDDRLRLFFETELRANAIALGLDLDDRRGDRRRDLAAARRVARARHDDASRELGADDQGVRPAAAARLPLAAADGGKASGGTAHTLPGGDGRRPGVAGQGPRDGADAPGPRAARPKTARPPTWRRRRREAASSTGATASRSPASSTFPRAARRSGRCGGSRDRLGADERAEGATMGERWFSDQELGEMARPTMERAIEALERGDAEQAAAALRGDEARVPVHARPAGGRDRGADLVRQGEARGRGRRGGVAVEPRAELAPAGGDDRRVRPPRGREGAGRDLARALDQRRRPEARVVRDRRGRREAHLHDEPVRIGAAAVAPGPLRGATAGA